MPAIMTKRGSMDNIITYEHICDTMADMATIERQYATLGSTCVVLAGEGGGLEVYMANSTGQWNALVDSASGSGSAAEPTLSFHLCGQNEVSNGMPNISMPDENVIYLVPSGNETGNLYEEYIYVDSAWEKFGSGGSSVDLSNYLQTTDIAAWAKAQQKPTYTADEVGAVSTQTLRVITPEDTVLELGTTSVTTNGSSAIISTIDINDLRLGEATLRIGTDDYNVHIINENNRYETEETTQADTPLLQIQFFDDGSIDLFVSSDTIYSTQQDIYLIYENNSKLVTQVPEMYIQTANDGTGGKKVATEDYVNAVAASPSLEYATTEDIYAIINQYGQEEDEGMVVEMTYDSNNNRFVSVANVSDIETAFKQGKNVVLHYAIENEIDQYAQIGMLDYSNGGIYFSLANDHAPFITIDNQSNKLIIEVPEDEANPS